MTSPTHSPWPAATNGLNKGEIFCLMANRPLTLTKEEEAELERRALHLVHLYGKTDPESVSGWRRASLVFDSDGVMLVYNENVLEVRVCEAPVKGDILLYTLAFQRLHEDGQTSSRRTEGLVALETLKRLMVLDDLANI